MGKFWKLNISFMVHLLSSQRDGVPTDKNVAQHPHNARPLRLNRASGTPCKFLLIWISSAAIHACPHYPGNLEFPHILMF